MPLRTQTVGRAHKLHEPRERMNTTKAMIQQKVGAVKSKIAAKKKWLSTSSGRMLT